MILFLYRLLDFRGRIVLGDDRKYSVVHSRSTHLKMLKCSKYSIELPCNVVGERRPFKCSTTSAGVPLKFRTPADVTTCSTLALPLNPQISPISSQRRIFSKWQSISLNNTLQVLHYFASKTLLDC